MENTYLKMIGQKVGGGKMILMTVVDDDFMDCGEVPNIFEVQCLKQAPTMFTGTYPTIKVNLETLKPRPDLKGMGASGVLTEESWYCAKREVQDIFGLAIPKT